MSIRSRCGIQKIRSPAGGGLLLRLGVEALGCLWLIAFASENWMDLIAYEGFIYDMLISSYLSVLLVVWIFFLFMLEIVAILTVVHLILVTYSFNIFTDIQIQLARSLLTCKIAQIILIQIIYQLRDIGDRLFTTLIEFPINFLIWLNFLN